MLDKVNHLRDTLGMKKQSTGWRSQHEYKCVYKNG